MANKILSKISETVRNWRGVADLTGSAVVTKKEIANIDLGPSVAAQKVAELEKMASINAAEEIRAKLVSDPGIGLTDYRRIDELICDWIEERQKRE